MVYIVEFTKPFKHARFYMGYCRAGRLNDRLKEHRSGHGATIIKRAAEQGIGIRLSVTIPDADVHTERQLKRWGGKSRIVQQAINTGKILGMPVIVWNTPDGM